MRGILRGERGLSALLLPVIVAWALAAVIILTGTLLAAHDIDDSVEVITSEVSAVDQDLDLIRLAEETDDIATRILNQVDPLPKELDKIIAIARQIDGVAGSILGKAREINGRVGEINARAASIRTNARAIQERAESIDTTVVAIFRTVSSINATVRNIDGTVQAIEGSVGGILRRFVATLDVARSIDTGVAGINRRARTIIELEEPLKSDLGRTLFQIGPGHREPDGQKTLHGHANGIDCDLASFPGLGQTPPPSQFCGK